MRVVSVEPVVAMAEHPSNYPHRRRNPLTGQWVLVSAHRVQRPWAGQIEASGDARPVFEPDCYLCPGNRRASGQVNPAYADTFVFENDFPALVPEVPRLSTRDSLLCAESVEGTSRVVCFSPRHDLTLAEMTCEHIASVIDVWSQESQRLSRDYAWVQVFENKGAAMGSSNPHPHGQIWASSALPSEAVVEDEHQRRYLEEHGESLLLAYAEREHNERERVVIESEYWLVVVPYWATWPFETLVLPRRHVASLPELEDGERAELALVLKKLLCKYDNLFEVSFPYSMGWHAAPTGPLASVGAREHWQLHAHFYPPLLRSASIKKFMVGYEMLAEAQRDLLPEAAAARLRATSDVHFRARA